jgi:hypothetical protein
LREAGYVAELRRAPSGDPLGFTVGRADDVSAGGLPVRYSGSKLGADLSLPKLLRRWGDRGPGELNGGQAVPEATSQADRAHRVVADARRAGDAAIELEDPAQVAHGLADVLIALRGWPGSGPELGAAAELFDRAARPPRGHAGRSGASTLGLRRAARQLIRQRRVANGSETDGMTALAVALVALVREIAAWQSERGRPHQSTAANATADVVERWTASQPDRSDDPDELAATVRVSPDLTNHNRAARQPLSSPHRRRASRQPRD